MKHTTVASRPKEAQIGLTVTLTRKQWRTLALALREHAHTAEDVGEPAHARAITGVLHAIAEAATR